MSLDLPADLENRVVRFAEETGLSPNEAFQTLVEAGLRRVLLAREEAEAGNPERIIGAFEDAHGLAGTFSGVIASREARYSKVQ